MAPKSQFSKEEEMLLRDFGRSLSKKSTVIFYFHGLVVSAVPLWLFLRIHQMELMPNAAMFAICTFISMYLITIAYKNNKFELKHKIAQKNESSIAKEINEKMLAGDTKKISRSEKDERILWRKNEIAEGESMQLSVLYSNTLYLLVLIFLSFYVLRSYSPTPNYLLSVFGAAGVTALLSTGTKKS